MAKVEITATIEKVARTHGKPEAKMLVSIPAESAGNVPLGKVSIVVESMQSELFKGPIRGDRSGTPRGVIARGTVKA